jgi:DNA polymerase-3 subunit delta
LGRSRRRPAKKGLSLGRLQKCLKAGEIGCVYLLLGDDAFLRQRALEALTVAIAGEAADEPGFEYEHIDAEEKGFAEILDAARSLSLFLPVRDHPVRLIRVSRFDTKNLEDVEALRDYLEKPVPETCLVLESRGLDGRLNATKLLLQHAVKVDCTAPTEPRDVARWIEGKCGSMGFAMTPDAVAYMIEMKGNNLQQLDQELQKLELYVGDQKRVDAKDLEALLERSREHSVFELTDALVAGDRQRCVEILNFLYDDGASAFEILPMIAWIVRQMVIAADLAEQGLPEKEIHNHLRLRWDARRSVVARAKRSKLADLQGLLVACAEADIPSKVRRGEAGRGTLEVLCRRVCVA